MRSKFANKVNGSEMQGVHTKVIKIIEKYICVHSLQWKKLRALVATTKKYFIIQLKIIVKNFVNKTFVNKMRKECCEKRVFP